jgi:hypothetical protein
LAPLCASYCERVLGQRIDQGDPRRVAKLSKLKAELIKELDDYCTELIQLTDSRLLRAADATTMVFDKKLTADYYRHSSEFKADSARQAGADKGQSFYESALQIANSGLTKANRANFGFALKYSVFFDEIIGQKKETIDLADKSFKERVDEPTEGNAPRQRSSSSSSRITSRSETRNRQTAKGVSEY